MRVRLVGWKAELDGMSNAPSSIMNDCVRERRYSQPHGRSGRHRVQLWLNVTIEGEALFNGCLRATHRRCQLRDRYRSLELIGQNTSHEYCLDGHPELHRLFVADVA